MIVRNVNFHYSWQGTLIRRTRVTTYPPEPAPWPAMMASSQSLHFVPALRAILTAIIVLVLLHANASCALPKKLSKTTNALISLMESASQLASKKSSHLMQKTNLSLQLVISPIASAALQQVLPTVCSVFLVSIFNKESVLVSATTTTSLTILSKFVNLSKL